MSIFHSAKGSEWEDHKYVKKIDGVYYYPVGYEDGRTIDSIKGKTEEEKKVNREAEIDKVKHHFDEYLKERGIDWRTLPKDEVDEMQRDIVKRLENEGKSGDKSADELAKEVISGKYGNGEDRKKQLGERYEEVQRIVNDVIKSSTGSKKVSEASEDSIKIVEDAAKKVSNTNSSNVHTGVNMEEVLKVYRTNKK